MVLVPQSMLETDGPGTGGSYDLDREVRVALNMLDEGGKDTITQVQFKIRVDEHEATAKALRGRSSPRPATRRSPSARRAASR
jgi:hypothetical protein